MACFGGFFEPYGIRRPQKYILNYYTPSERECLPCRIVCLNIVRGFGCFSAFTGRAPTAGTYPARCAAPAPTAAAAAQARPAPDLGRGTFENMRSGGVRLPNLVRGGGRPPPSTCKNKFVRQIREGFARPNFVRENKFGRPEADRIWYAGGGRPRRPPSK